MNEILVVGCTDRTWAAPDGTWHLWLRRSSCEVSAVRFNGGASAHGPVVTLRPGGDIGGIVLRVPPAPEWAPEESWEDDWERRALRQFEDIWRAQASAQTEAQEELARHLEYGLCLRYDYPPQYYCDQLREETEAWLEGIRDRRGSDDTGVAGENGR